MLSRLSYAVLLVFALTIVVSAKSAQAACSSPVGTAGSIIYNQTEKLFQYCNDTDWVRMTSAGSGSGGCANPSVTEGELVYNTDYRVLQGCAGNVFRAAGPVGGSQLGGWKAVGIGGYGVCGIKRDGTLWCWGDEGWFGAMGNGPDSSIQYAPLQISSDEWLASSTGNVSTCAIKADNTMWCWGGNYYGQIGMNDADDRDVPTEISGGGSWKKVSVGIYHSCGIKADNTLHCWGTDDYGQLGNGASGNSYVPVEVNGGGSWIDVDVGDRHSCGVKSDNTLYCWGRDNLGQLGNGAGVTADQQSPYLVAGGALWLDVSAGDYHACGIKTDNTLHCWGNDSGGALGNGAGGNTSSPGAVSGGGTWKFISAAGASCGIKSDDSLWCWGANSDGQVGNGNKTNQQSPVAIAAGTTWSYVAGSYNANCGIKTDGQLLCWGNNYSHNLGQGNPFKDFSAPQPVAGGNQWNKITVGDEHSCGIKADGTGWCMGTDSDGQLGNGVGVTGSKFVPDPMAGGGTWLDMSAGAYHTCGIKSDNTGWCWGAGWDTGMTGDGTGQTARAPVQLDDGGATWLQITSGNLHSCGIQSDGSAWCWGGGWNGELGNGANNDEFSPVPVSGGYTWKQLSGGAGYTCGIKSDDTAWCWGANGLGELGDNTYTDSNVPVQVAGGGTWKFIAAGYDQTCGIKSDETVWCWGEDNVGQLGNGPGITGNQGLPVQISGSGSWKFLSLGSGISCGIMRDDSAWCWGSDSSWEMGNGPVAADSDIPYAIQGGGLWSSLSASRWGFSCGIVQSEAWCWGSSWSGSLGVGSINGDDIVSPSTVLCGGPEGRAGQVLYNETSNALQYCDGSNWVEVRQ